MFPSGPWRGYWEQGAFGRQPMEPLELRFENGRIEGEGRDCVGPFTFSGQYTENGAVVLVKQYLERHAVMYQGQHDGEGTIFGQWSIGEYYSGNFALTPLVKRASTDAPIREL